MKGRGGGGVAEGDDAGARARGGNPERALMAKKRGGGVARRARGRRRVARGEYRARGRAGRVGDTARWIGRGGCRGRASRVGFATRCHEPKVGTNGSPETSSWKRTEGGWGGRQRPVARGGRGTHRLRRWRPYPCRAYGEAGTCAAATPWSSAAARCGRSPGGSSSPQAVYAPRVRSLTAKTMRPFARRSSIADCEREAGAGVSARSARVAGARPDPGPLAARARRRRLRGAYLPFAETRS